MSRDFPALFENDQCRNAAYTVAGGKALFLFGVEFGQAYMGFQLRGGLCEGRRHHLARAAPGSPEIHDDRNIAAADMAIEAVGVQLQRMGVKQGLFAFTAVRGLLQSFRIDAIGRIAVRTNDM